MSDLTREAKLNEWRTRYPRRADRFRDEKAFLDFVDATHVEKRVITESYHRNAGLWKPENVAKVRLAWAIQDASQAGTYFRVFIPTEDPDGQARIEYDTAERDDWPEDRFEIIELRPYVFKIVARKD